MGFQEPRGSVARGRMGRTVAAVRGWVGGCAWAGGMASGAAACKGEASCSSGFMRASEAWRRAVGRVRGPTRGAGGARDGVETMLGLTGGPKIDLE